MPNFAWTGRDSSGKTVSGVMTSTSPGAVAMTLNGNGTTPLSIRPTTEAATDIKKDNGFTIFKQKVQHTDLLLFSRQMHTLLRAGVPIVRALAGLQESAVNPALKEIISKVKTSLESGKEFSRALAEHPKVFSKFYLSMIAVGESTGMLDEVFLRLAEHMEFERFMREQVKTALRYPSFVVIAMAVAITIVNIFVIPAFSKVFEGFNAELPAITRGLLAFSNFMVTYWPLMLLSIVCVIIAFKWWTSTPKGRRDWEAITLKIPIAGKIVAKAAMARFARGFALGTRSGVPLMQALANSAQTVDNTYIAAKIEGMRSRVERGDSVLNAATAVNFFTPVVLQMIAVGEESGSLDSMMEEIGQMYQREVQYELNTLGQQIEPILIVSLGVLVLLLALGIFLPMWDMGKAAMGR